MIERIIKIVQSDKALHFLVGFFIAVAIQPYFIGAVLAIVMGIVKEIYDRKTPGHVSDIFDLVATVAGSLIGLLIIILYQQ